MKKTLLLILAALAVTITCQRVETSVSDVLADVIYARLDDDPSTRTFLDGEGNVRWSEGDQIKAFMKSPAGIRYFLAESSAGDTNAEFRSDLSFSNTEGSSVWDHNVVIYPYSSSAVCERTDDGYQVSYRLPDVQKYSEGSFGNGTFPMIAVSQTNEITFRNILGGLKLQLSGKQNVRYIKVEGHCSERLAGNSLISVSDSVSIPSIKMSDSASTSVTLDCGEEGVQLDGDGFITFIISLPPVEFSKGFTVTVTDTYGYTQTVSTSKKNTVRRSNLLQMPPVKLQNLVNNIVLDDDEITLPPGISFDCKVQVYPEGAVDGQILWSSDNESVAVVDQSGVVTAVAPGSADVTVSAGRVSRTFTVSVVQPAAAVADYIDSYNVNHGKGIAIGDVVWAPVNCGYKPADAATKGYAYGLLYQWGRLYGQGYVGDESEPKISSALSEQAQSESNSNRFYKSKSDNYYDWSKTRNDAYWNSGSASYPLKTQYDPCPDGWRVPTESELGNLILNSSALTIYKEQNGYWFSGIYDYKSDVPQVFLPAAGFRDDSDAGAYNRGIDGRYWSSGSSTAKSKKAYAIVFTDKTLAESDQTNRAYGYAVRCVQQ